MNSSSYSPLNSEECRIRGTKLATGADVPAQPRTKKYHEIPMLTPEQSEKFWSQVGKGTPSGCWLWRGHSMYGKKGGSRYGLVYLKVGGRFVGFKAHRVAYTLLVGPIPDGDTLDHLRESGPCTSTLCVNPAHLEPVTQSENTKRYRRSLPRVCQRGHQMAPTGNCQECIRIKTAEWHEKNRETVAQYRREWYAQNRDKVSEQRKTRRNRKRVAA